MGQDGFSRANFTAANPVPGDRWAMPGASFRATGTKPVTERPEALPAAGFRWTRLSEAVQIRSPRLNLQEKPFGQYAEVLFRCPVGTFRSTAEFKPNRTG